MTLGKFLESGKSLEVGDLIKFRDGSTLLIGDATIYASPKDCGNGWLWDYDPCTREIE